MAYSRLLKELAANDPPAFICHYYNFYFAHTAGGRMIGNKVWHAHLSACPRACLCSQQSLAAVRDCDAQYGMRGMRRHRSLRVNATNLFVLPARFIMHVNGVTS